VIGPGKTLVSRLTDGIEWTALSVSTGCPLFWFLGNAEVKSMADLRGRRLAVHGPADAPGAFARGRFLGRLTQQEARQHYDRYVGPYLVPGRVVDTHAAQQSVDAVAKELDVAPVYAADFYRRQNS
jgi:hypothetical protein